MPETWGRRLAAPDRTRGRVRAISCQLRGQATAVKDPALPVRPCLFQRNRLAADVTDESSRHTTWKIVGHWYIVNPTNVWLAPHSYRPYGTPYRPPVFTAVTCRALLFRRVAASTAGYPRDSLLKLTTDFCICIKEKGVLPNNRRALNSAVECHPHTVEVVGSNPTAPTIFQIPHELSSP